MKSKSDHHKSKTSPDKSAFESLEKEISLLKQEVENWKAKYLRALADYQNYERRVDEEKKKFYFQAKRDFLLRLLPVVDGLERAEIFIQDSGLKLIKDQFEGFLRELGVKEIDILGKIFDPKIAEAIELVDGEVDNQVTEVVKRGYYLEDEILRPALVKVSKRRTNDQEKDKNQQAS